MSGVNKTDTGKLIDNLNFSQAGTFKNISKKCLKLTSDICNPSLAAMWNEELMLNQMFPQKFKLADKTPVYLKEDSTKNKSGVLLIVSKIFERLMKKQIKGNINQCLSAFLCDYRKGFSTQTALVWLIEKSKH